MSFNAVISKIELPTQGNSFIGEAYHVYAGSFISNWEKLEEEGYFAVNLTHEGQHYPSSLSIPILDYDVPKGDVNASFEENLKLMLQKMIDGEKVFFGCFGGIGRTGIVLACLYKVFGVENNNIVYYTRLNLHKKAIETPEQTEFVKNFNPSALKLELEEMYLNKLIEKSSINRGATAQVDFSLITKIKQFMLRQPGNLNFVETLFKYSSSEEISYLINNNILHPLKDEYTVLNSVGNILDLAYKYKVRPVIKDLVIGGLTPYNKSFEDNINFSDKCFIMLLRLSSKIKNIKPSNYIGNRPNV